MEVLRENKKIENIFSHHIRCWTYSLIEKQWTFILKIRYLWVAKYTSMREIDVWGIKWVSDYNKYDKVYNWICFLSQNIVANEVNINSQN